MTETLNKWQVEEKQLGERPMSFNKTLKTDTAYSVTFLDEGEEIASIYEGKKQLAFKVRIVGGGLVGTELTWYVTKSQRRDSLFGMLATLFARAGQAVGVRVDVAATGSQKDRRYTVKQYNDLVFAGGVGK